MGKYTKELKLEVVKYYLENGGGYETVAKKFNIAAFGTVMKWVKNMKSTEQED